MQVNEEMAGLEKKLTMTKVSLKEVTRRADNELEARRKVEALLAETKKKLEEEQNKRTREMNNNQQTNDKMNGLEKQVIELQDTAGKQRKVRTLTFKKISRSCCSFPF